MTILVTAVVTLPGGLAAQRDDRTQVSGNSVESLVGNEEVCRQAQTSDARPLHRSAVETVGLDAKAGQVLQDERAAFVVVVVTDLAWPHVAGVRYWVSRGATVVSHRISEAFLRRVVQRRWTLEPDRLEQRRDDVEFNFVGIDGLATMAGGDVRLAPIDGIGSEGALITYLSARRFLWASDYIQRADRPTAYATEVWHAVRRPGFDPVRVAAQHLPLTEWATVEALQIREE